MKISRPGQPGISKWRVARGIEGDWHYFQRLGRWVELERSETNAFGWLDVVDAKLAGGKKGYRIKMRLNPNNSKAQDFLKGCALPTPRAAAIRRAEYVAENPFPPKEEGRKVCSLCCLFAQCECADMRSVCVCVRVCRESS